MRRHLLGPRSLALNPDTPHQQRWPSTQCPSGGKCKRNEECGQRGSRSAGMRAPLRNAPATLPPAIPINTWRRRRAGLHFRYSDLCGQQECRAGGREGEERAGHGRAFVAVFWRRLWLLLQKAWSGPFVITPVESRRHKVSNLPVRNMWQLMLHTACLLKLEDSDPWLQTGDITIM